MPVKPEDQQKLGSRGLALSDAAFSIAFREFSGQKREDAGVCDVSGVPTARSDTQMIFDCFSVFWGTLTGAGDTLLARLNQQSLPASEELRQNPPQE